MPGYDLLIKGGTIIDGTGLPRFVGDLAIANGVIQRVGNNIDPSRASKVIDAEGLIVAPGAIDCHSHFDAQVHWDPYCTPNSWHGMTTQVVTNCGFGFAPCKPNMRVRYMEMMETTEQVSYGASERALTWDWETFPQWMEHMRRLPKGVNIAHYFPLNPAFSYVMGPDEAKVRAATRTEMAELKGLLNRAMDAGACGFSFTHMNDTSSHTDSDGSPMPTDVHPPEDFYKLAEVLKERDQGLIQALLDLPGVRNGFIAEEMARVSRRRVLHNVAGPYDDDPEFHREILAWLDKCQAEGLDIYSFSQGRPFLSAQFSFQENNLIGAVSYFQRFIHASREEKKRLALDPEFLRGAREAYDPAIFGANATAFDGMVLVNAGKASRFAKYQGQRMGDVARAEKADLVDTVFRVVAESDVEAEFKTYMNVTGMDGFRECWAHPRVLICGTDGGAHLQLVANGDTPTEIINYIVKDHGIASLEHAHYRMSQFTAQVMGFDRRGSLQEGFAADLMIYDYDNVRSTRTYERIYDLPDGSFRLAVRANGMRWVLVNGEAIFIDGEGTGALPGRLIGNGGSATDERLIGAERLAAE